MISLLLTLILGFASDSCNNKDIILILGYNYNLILTNRRLCMLENVRCLRCLLTPAM